jgi:dihydropteroate synthase
MKKILNCNGRLLDLSTPAIMGILNLTPDSFHDGNHHLNETDVLKSVESMLNAGADIIDIGGQSTRPGAKRITEKEEWNRIQKYLQKIVSEFPDAILSIDTFYSTVAARSVYSGVSIINDISSGSIDPEIISVAARTKCPYILMHMQGTPETMQQNPHYENVVKEVLDFIVGKISILRDKGITDIVIDPGFGFGKTLNQNYEPLYRGGEVEPTVWNGEPLMHVATIGCRQVREENHAQVEFHLFQRHIDASIGSLRHHIVAR